LVRFHVPFFSEYLILTRMHASIFTFLTSQGSPTTPPHKLTHTFKFKDYAPVAFAYLRRMFGVNEFDFLLSVCGNANFIEFISNAKSGQFFFYSSDGKYMIKTMTNTESKFLRRSK
jgi:1-phosphatidylinositol-4-phosphate 5-kinase